MTFEAYEDSVQGGTPLELYEFSHDVTTVYFNSSWATYTYLTKDYLPAALQRTQIDETSEVAKSDLRITCAHDFAIAALFDPYPPSSGVNLRLRRLHRTDGDIDAKLFWIGRVISCAWEGAQAILTCESILTSMRRPGLRRNYQRSCPHVLYGAACGVAATSFRTTTTLTSLAGISITSADFDIPADGYFNGGYLEWEPEAGRIERRALRNHVGDTIDMSHPIEGLASGDEVNVFAGCAHDMPTCEGTFSNSDNYGGFLQIPKKNPFGGNPVF